MADPLVRVDALTRTFRVLERRPGLRGMVHDWWAPRAQERSVVDGVSFEAQPGQVLALLGANGAGKSTVVKSVVGLLQPTSGTVRVNGLDPFVDRQAVVRRMGVVFGQRSQLWWDLAVRESLDLLGALYGLAGTERRDALVEALEIGALLDRPVRELSHGQRVRCDLVASLLHSPEVLVLDEPTVGLDAAARAAVRDVVRACADQSATVLLATHDLSEVEAIADQVVLLERGRSVFHGTPQALLAWLGGRRVLVVTTREPVSPERVAALETLLGTTVFLAGVELRLAIDVDAVQRTRAVFAQVDVAEFRTEDSSLEQLLAHRYHNRDAL